MAWPIKLHKPPRGRVVVPGYADRLSNYPSSGLTPQRLAAIFREADAGDISRQMELFAEIEEKDPHLAAQLQTRKQAVTGLDWEIVPYQADNAEDKEIAEYVADQLHGLEDWEGVCMDLLDAIGKGYAVAEIMWDTSGPRVTINRIDRVPQTCTTWDEYGRMRLITAEHPSGIALPPDKFVVHRYQARSGHPTRAGILRVIAWTYLFKNYSLKDWVSFCDVYGMPLRLGKYAPDASQEDKDALIAALLQLGTDAAGIIPQGADIQFVADAGKASTAAIYEGLARYCDEQISKAVLGQTLTSDSGGGSYAQSKTHNEVRHDLTEADCKALAATLRRDLIRPLVLYNYGAQAAERLPHIRWDSEEPADLQETVKIYETLTGLGLPVPLSHLYDKFGIPKPRAGEPVTSRPSVQLPMTQRDGMQAMALTADSPALRRAAETQRRVDRLADTAISGSGAAFDRLFAPVKELTDGAQSLDEIAAALQDEETVLQLTQRMDAGALEELIARASCLADMEGRNREQT